MDSQTKVCQNCNSEFVIEPDDFAFYEKMKVPPPTWCAECRRQRRLSWRNDFVFYNRNCDLCKRNIISIYSPESPQVIYCNKCWWGDSWDPKQYAQDFDFNRPFFDQFREFRLKVPTLALVNDNNIGSENCEYTQNFALGKNCYMAMVSWKVENCMYTCYCAETKDTVDSMGIFSTGEGLYEVMYSDKCFGCRNVYGSSSLMNCAYCVECVGCENCFMSVNLRNKQYYILNKQYTKEEYEKIIDAYKIGSRNGCERAQLEFNNFLITQPRRFVSSRNCLNCTGNNIINSKNSKNVFHCRRSEDSKYLENGDTQKDSYDLCSGGELS